MLTWALVSVAGFPPYCEEIPMTAAMVTAAAAPKLTSRFIQSSF
jgi:hypothetical protein